MEVITQQEIRPQSGARVDEMPAMPRVPGMPESIEHEWRKTYAARFADSESDFPQDKKGQQARRHDALRQANRIFRTPQIGSFAEAMALPEWQVHPLGDNGRTRFKKRDKKSGKLMLWLITIDAKKYSFEIPAGAEDSVPSEAGAAQPAAAAK